MMTLHCFFKRVFNDMMIVHYVNMMIHHDVMMIHHDVMMILKSFNMYMSDVVMLLLIG